MDLGFVLVLVSPEAYPILAPHPLYVSNSGYPYFYGPRGLNGERGRRIYVHQQLLPVNEGLEVDHRNGNRLDCRRGNLRPATRAQNMVNRGRPVRQEPPSSQYRGVVRHQGRWSARIGFQKRSLYLGTFDSEAGAALAYNAKAIELYGAEFAKLNDVGDAPVSSRRRRVRAA